MYVKAAPRLINGEPLVVRDPDLKDHLPPEGRDVPETDYWLRRLREGDAVLTEPPSEQVPNLVAVMLPEVSHDADDRPD